jgi:predicted phosphodiesterase
MAALLSLSIACAFLSPVEMLSGLFSTVTPTPTITITTTPTITPTPTVTFTPTATSTSTSTPTQTSTPTPTPTQTPTITPTLYPGEHFAFVVNSDIHYFSGKGEYDTDEYFRGMCEAIDQLDAAHFMVTVGDMSPALDVRYTIDHTLGKDFLWFPVMGNHEYDDKKTGFKVLRDYDLDPNGDLPPNIINRGPEGCPETTYSFNYGNSHFVVLNEYCDVDRVTDGAMVKPLRKWLKDDLEANKQTHIFVFGHEPAYPLPDVDNEQERHVGDSLDAYPKSRDLFWKILDDYDVVAFFSGHTHTFNAAQFDGVWQINDGHASGKRTLPTLSTFLMVYVDGDNVRLEVHRAGRKKGYDTKRYTVDLTGN